MRRRIRRNSQKAALRDSSTPERLLPPKSNPGGPPFESYVNAYWSGNKVVLVSRDEAGEVQRRSVPADYSVFLRCKDVNENVESYLRRSNLICGMQTEGDWWRVTFRDFRMREKWVAKDGNFDALGIETFEGDLNPVRRWLTDNNVTIQKPRRCYLDLETDSRKTFVQATNGKARILTWAVHDDAGNSAKGVLEAETDKDEKELIEDLWRKLYEYDQVCAWNGGSWAARVEGFDFPVLKGRTRLFNINIDHKRWLWVDQMVVFERMNKAAAKSGDEKDSISLESVGQALLGRGKSPLMSRFAYEYWAAGTGKFKGYGRQDLSDYNVNDTVLQADIEKECGYLDLMFSVCSVCHTFPDGRGSNPTNYWEGYLLRMGLASNEHFRTKYYLEDVEKYKGAVVVPPRVTGIVKNVHVCDFARLYPSVIISFNMCPTTITDIVPEVKQTKYLKQIADTIVVPEGHSVSAITNKVFRSEVDGIIPRAMEELQKLRDYWKKKKAEAEPNSPEYLHADRQQSAYKICINSGYGVLGSPWSRFYDKDLAESITQSSVWLLESTLEYAEKRGYQVIYGDTDSSFVSGVSIKQFGSFVDDCNANLYPKLLKDRGAPKNVVSLEFEKSFSKIIFTDMKKRYAGRIAWAGSKEMTKLVIEVKGLEYKRGDVARLARRMQWQFILAVLKHDIEDPDEIEMFVRLWQWRVLNMPMKKEDYVISKSLGKAIPQYKQKIKKDGTLSALPAHVRIAKVLAERGEEVRIGTRIEYVVTDSSTKPATVIPLCDVTDDTLDRFYLWEKQIYPPTMRLLGFAFPTVQWKKKYLKVRPKKSRKKAAKKTTKKVKEKATSKADVPCPAKAFKFKRRRITTNHGTKKTNSSIPETRKPFFRRASG